MRVTLRAGFLMDPLESIRVDHDSTFALMLEAQRRSHEVVYLRPETLSVQGCKPVARAEAIRVSRTVGSHFSVLESRVQPLEDLDVLFLRQDPPVNVAFLHTTQLMDLLGPKGPLLINDPRGLRDANEKLFALRFPECIPPTLVSRDKEQILRFVEEVGGRAVLKPLDGHGGAGVVCLDAADPNRASLIELLTQRGTLPAVAQAYLPAAAEGDKRIVVLNGEPVGAILRVAQGREFRCNMAAGGVAVKTRLTPRDLEICRAVGPALREHGLLLVGLDVIGDFLIEINVTSPTGLVEIDQLDEACVESKVWDFVENRLRFRPSTTSPATECPSPPAPAQGHALVRTDTADGAKMAHRTRLRRPQR